MKQLISILAITTLLLSACTGNNNKQTNADADYHHGIEQEMHQHDMEEGSGMNHQMDSSPMTVQESKTTSMVIDAYLKMKNALVTDNDKEAAKAGNELINAFDTIDKNSVPEGKMSELEDIIKDAREHADHISENQGNIEHQREHFEMLSSDIKDLIAVAGCDRTLYLIYCPMYNNNEGGSWLSASDEIKNPYYGSKMTNCGEVKSKISIK